MWKKRYERVSVRFSGYGHYEITTKHMYNEVTIITNDMPLIDKFKNKEWGWKTAGNRLHDLCVEGI